MEDSHFLVLLLWLGIGLGVFELVDSDSDVGQPPNSSLTAAEYDWHQQHEYLLRYNFLPESYRESGRNATDEEFWNGIMDLQYMAGLPETGIFDQRTEEIFSRKRCGIVDNVTAYREGSQNRNPQLDWPKRNFMWSVMRYGNPDMSFHVVQRIMPQAFEFWQANTNLTFNQELMRREDTDIKIAFEKGFHGDSFLFDGISPGHAFPRDSRHSGEVHLDATADWLFHSAEEEPAVNGSVSLLSALIHELGHTLGLHHSNNPSSVMYPWFRNELQSSFQLTGSEVHQIQSLQPQATEVTTSISTGESVTTQVPEDPHHNCLITSVESALYARGRAFFFQNQTYWMLKNNDIENMHRRRPIHEFWYDFPVNAAHIDAAYENPNSGHVLFFVGRKYYQFKTNKLSPNFPKDGRPLTEFGLPHSIERIDAAFVWAHNQQTYFITGDMYWKYDEQRKKLVEGYPRDMRLWRGVTTPVDAAITMFNDELYFISGDKYERFDSWQMKVVERGPLSNLMGCLSLTGDENQTYHPNNNSHKNMAGHLQPSSDLIILQSSLLFFLLNVLII